MTEMAHLRGRPRRPEVNDAVLTATVKLVAELGYAHTTIDAIARLAAVAKTTVYRRWRSKEDLAIDALAFMLGDSPTGHSSGEASVREAISWLALRIREGPVRALLIGLLAEAAHNPELRAHLRTRFRKPFLVRLITEWHLNANDVDVAFDIVVGGLLHRLATGDDVDSRATDAFVSAAMNLLFPPVAG